MSVVDPLPPPARPRRRMRPWSLALVVALVFGFWFVPHVWRLSGGSVSVTRWDKKRGKTEAVVGPAEKGWITTKRVSHHVLHAIIAAEDGKFYQHRGIDWESTLDSARYNWKKGHYARGASTISQQVVKMAFLDREKTLTRKAREALGVVLMETLLTKDQILEWYINLAEFGDGVYGINDGSWHYFKTKPELLTIEQAVHLALVLPSPNAWSGGLRRHQLTKFGQKRFAAILNNLKNAGYITKVQWITALSRGDFGRPVAGYEALVVAEEAHKELCPGSPGCPDEGDDEAWDEETEPPLAFPGKAADRQLAQPGGKARPTPVETAPPSPPPTPEPSVPEAPPAAPEQTTPGEAEAAGVGSPGVGTGPATAPPAAAPAPVPIPLVPGGAPLSAPKPLP